MPQGGTKKLRQMPHPKDHLESNTAQELINQNEKVSLAIYFSMLFGRLPVCLSSSCSSALMSLIKNMPN